MSVGFIGGSLFKSSSKFSTILVRYSWILVIVLPSLFLASRSDSISFPATFFAVSYTCIIRPLFSAYSAVLTDFSPSFYSSFPMFLLTRLLFTVYPFASWIALFLFGRCWSLSIPSLNYIQGFDRDPILTMIFEIHHLLASWISAFLIRFHLFSIVVSPSLSRICRAWCLSLSLLVIILIKIHFCKSRFTPFLRAWSAIYNICWLIICFPVRVVKEIKSIKVNISTFVQMSSSVNDYVYALV